MANPLFQMMNQTPANNNLLQRFRQFQQTFKGDPQQTVQQMLNSGRISQAQYNQAVQTANQLMRMLGGK